MVANTLRLLVLTAAVQIVLLLLGLVGQISGGPREVLVSMLRSPGWLAHIRGQARSPR